MKKETEKTPQEKEAFVGQALDLVGGAAGNMLLWFVSNRTALWMLVSYLAANVALGTLYVATSPFRRIREWVSEALGWTSLKTPLSLVKDFVSSKAPAKEVTTWVMKEKPNADEVARIQGMLEGLRTKTEREIVVSSKKYSLEVDYMPHIMHKLLQLDLRKQVEMLRVLRKLDAQKDYEKVVLTLMEL